MLPNLSRPQVKFLLQEMKQDGIIKQCGKTSASKWYLNKVATKK